EKWTASEKITYGPAFAAISHSAATPKSTWSLVFRGGDSQYGVPRKPSDVKVFVDSIVGVISNGSYGPSFLGLGLGLGKVRNWLRGDRFSVGAGGRFFSPSWTKRNILISLCSPYIHDCISLPFFDSRHPPEHSCLPHWYQECSTPVSALCLASPFSL